MPHLQPLPRVPRRRHLQLRLGLQVYINAVRFKGPPRQRRQGLRGAGGRQGLACSQSAEKHLSERLVEPIVQSQSAPDVLSLAFACGEPNPVIASISGRCRRPAARGPVLQPDCITLPAPRTLPPPKLGPWGGVGQSAALLPSPSC